MTHAKPGEIKARDGRGRMMREIDTAERDMRAAEMRSRSMTLQQIATELGVSVPSVHRMIQRAFESIPTEGAAQAKANELAKIDRIEAHLLGVMERAHVRIDHGRVIRDDNDVPLLDDAPGVQAANSLLRVQERRAKLMGYDAPTRQIIQVVPQEVVDAEIIHLEAQLVEHQGGSVAGELEAPGGT